MTAGAYGRGGMRNLESGIRSRNRNPNRNPNPNPNLRNKTWRRFCFKSVTNNYCSIKTFHPHIIFICCYCDVIALDVPLVLAGGLFYHVLLVLVLARLKLLCYSLFCLSITLHGVRSGIDEP